MMIVPGILQKAGLQPAQPMPSETNLLMARPRWIGKGASIRLRQSRMTEAELEKWRRVSAMLAEEQRQHDEEWRERRARRGELEALLEARKKELRAGRRAERAAELERLKPVMAFVEARLKPKEDDDAEQTP